MLDGLLNQPVAISYADLMQEDLSSLDDDISRAFGSAPECLGLIILENLPPSFARLRDDALRAAAHFAHDVPEEVQDLYTDPASSYSFGWSHGKEIINGKPDMFKGSYYANPAVDRIDVDEEARQAHPTYFRDNIWPSEKDCPGFENAFKALAQFMTETGKRLAKACDHLVASSGGSASIEQLISSSQCSKARLLHYYPPSDQLVTLANTISFETKDNDQPSEVWCGDHVDHSLITALVPAMYLFHPTRPLGSKPLRPMTVPPPTAGAGLFIRTRAGGVVQARMPSNSMAFQTGEALQLLTRDELQATPHYVANGQGEPILRQTLEFIHKERMTCEGWNEVVSGVISRETMAVFLQPDVNVKIGKDGETFGEYTNRIVQSHYQGLRSPSTRKSPTSGLGLARPGEIMQ